MDEPVREIPRDNAEQYMLCVCVGPASDLQGLANALQLFTAEYARQTEQVPQLPGGPSGDNCSGTIASGEEEYQFHYDVFNVSAYLDQPLGVWTVMHICMREQWQSRSDQLCRYCYWFRDDVCFAVPTRPRTGAGCWCGMWTTCDLNKGRYSKQC